MTSKKYNGTKATELLLSLIKEKFDTKIDKDGYESYLKNKALDWFYPVGSVYTSAYDTSPSELFGGTWTQLENTYLTTTDNECTQTYRWIRNT